MLNIVLFEPEIPENTGNIARTCVGFNAQLHLIRPYGFFLNNKKLIRSGIDYWQSLKLYEYDDFNDFVSKNKPQEIYYITRYGKHLPNEIKFDINKNTFLVFGKESSGIDKKILKENYNNTIRIPSSKNVRSMNLSNCVAIMAYEVLKQNSYNELSIEEPHKNLFDSEK